MNCGFLIRIFSVYPSIAQRTVFDIGEGASKTVAELKSDHVAQSRHILAADRYYIRCGEDLHSQ